MTFTSPTPRRVRSPGWLDLRLVLGIVLVIAAVLLGATVVAGASHTYQRVAVTRDLAAGTLLTAGDVEVVNVQLPAVGRSRYLDDSGKAVGKMLGRAVARGELLPLSAVGLPPALTTVSVPFGADAAPKLADGQRIEVWLSTRSCPSVVLLADVTVQQVRASDTSTFGSDGAQDVVLSVPSGLADRVVGALALDGATIRAGVLTGMPPSARVELPALDGCGPAATPTS